MKLFKKILLGLGLAAVVFVGVSALPGQSAFAATTSTKQEVCDAIGSGTDCSGNNGGDLSGVIATIINVLSLLVGIVAVIMIIFAGFKYITAGGDTNKITSAKNALIYALVGLVIVALAQFMVHFVLKQTKKVAEHVQYTVATITLK